MHKHFVKIKAFIFTLLFAVHSMSQNKLNDTPLYLYHWVASSTLGRIAKLGISQSRIRKVYQTPSGAAPFFKPIEVIGGDIWEGQSPNERTTALVASFPELSGRVGVFTTLNPATGSLGANSERYGDILVRFKINRSRVRQATLTPSSAFSNVSDSLSSHDKIANLIFHNGAVKEWIILDPSIIESFTADPEVLRPELELLLKKLKLPKEHPEFKFDEGDFHYNDGFNNTQADYRQYFVRISPNVRNYAIYAISKFLKYGRALIPHEYIGETNLAQPLPSIRQISKSLRELKVEENKLVEREKWIGTFPPLNTEMIFEENLYIRIYQSLELALQERVKSEIKKYSPISSQLVSIYDSRDLFWNDVDTAVFAPIASIGYYRNYFFGRFHVFGLQQVEHKQPFKQLTQDEIDQIEKLFALASDPQTTASQLIEMIVGLYEIEDLVYERLEEVFKKYEVPNFLSKNYYKTSCRELLE